MSEIDLDSLEKFINELPPDSPEFLLEMAAEAVEDEIEMGIAVSHDDIRMANEAVDILERWERSAEPIPTEVKRFEAEAFFTRHRFIGAEGVPGTDKIRGIQ